MSDRTTPIQSVQVYPAACFRVSAGANLGDGISWHEELELNDYYMLEPGALRGRLSLQADVDGGFHVAEDTGLGHPGARLHLDCALTFMSPDGQTQDAVVIVELDETDSIAGLYLLSLSELQPRVEYALVGVNPDGARACFARVACVYFTRGTHITLSTGEQRLIEDLQVGDRVLTRDDGAQEIRWIGASTVRAQGDMAPVVIEAGALNNAHDLVVSPDHRLFVYQRQDRIGAGQAELMVKARHLVNGDTVRIASGGFVEYFQILFDRHHIIYAEGIAAESMLVDPRTRPSLPPELLEKLTEVMPGHARSGHHGIDVQQALLDRPDAIDILRRASTR
ncbi:Hint domain-containing protein [Aestuariivita boseongensis]|uniref:Hint domain-containing protein n=1 Tax=Aestuariivita boseongensis TaxID=1470562 RepID=UPI00068111DE|nr:Hint domain-containing protein [Aestuariivita boseongensis]